mmetsp:Transcript_32495/g.61191  ORF Transcript_32495/g.61191 Transcript_32495/m.61191 type:complete len:338 (-) Transcript_32495:261-1274(-)
MRSVQPVEVGDLEKPQSASRSRSSSSSTRCGSGSGSAGSTPVGLQSDSSPSVRKARTNASPTQGLPEIEYPMSFTIVRDADGVPEHYDMCIINTFWEMKARSPGSLEDFLAERQIRSCPASRLGAPESEGVASIGTEAFVPSADAVHSELDGCDTATEVWEHEQLHPDLVKDSTAHTAHRLGGGQALLVPPGPVAHGNSGFHALSPGQRQPFLQLPTSAVTGTVPSPLASFSIPRLSAPPVAPPELEAPGFAEVSAPPPPTKAPTIATEDPSTELPSVGSMGHDEGTCRPCAFLFKKGCISGKDCAFCHRCPPGEKKRRSKERKSETKKPEEEGGKA